MLAYPFGDEFFRCFRCYQSPKFRFNKKTQELLSFCALVTVMHVTGENFGTIDDTFEWTQNKRIPQKTGRRTSPENYFEAQFIETGPTPYTRITVAPLA
jgi:hypothetical protein